MAESLANLEDKTTNFVLELVRFRLIIGGLQYVTTRTMTQGTDPDLKESKNSKRLATPLIFILRTCFLSMT